MRDFISCPVCGGAKTARGLDGSALVDGEWTVGIARYHCLSETCLAAFFIVFDESEDEDDEDDDFLDFLTTRFLPPE